MKSSKKYYLKFRVEDLPRTRNSLTYDNRYARVREKNRWLQLVTLAVGYRVPETPLTLVDLKLTRASSRIPDYDGLVSSFKYVIDAMVKIGILQDDNLNVIPNPLYEWTKTKRGKGYIEIEVKECSPTDVQKSSKNG